MIWRNTRNKKKPRVVSYLTTTRYLHVFVYAVYSRHMLVSGKVLLRPAMYSKCNGYVVDPVRVVYMRTFPSRIGVGDTLQSQTRCYAVYVFMCYVQLMYLQRVACSSFCIRSDTLLLYLAYVPEINTFTESSTFPIKRVQKLLYTGNTNYTGNYMVCTKISQTLQVNYLRCAPTGRYPLKAGCRLLNVYNIMCGDYEKYYNVACTFPSEAGDVMSSQIIKYDKTFTNIMHVYVCFIFILCECCYR